MPSRSQRAPLTEPITGSWFEGIERLYSIQQIADDKVLVLYQKNQQTISELYNVPAMVRLQQSSIPKVNLN